MPIAFLLKGKTHRTSLQEMTLKHMMKKLQIFVKFGVSLQCHNPLLLTDLERSHLLWFHLLVEKKELPLSMIETICVQKKCLLNWPINLVSLVSLFYGISTWLSIIYQYTKPFNWAQITVRFESTPLSLSFSLSLSFFLSLSLYMYICSLTLTQTPPTPTRTYVQIRWSAHKRIYKSYI